MKRIITLFAVLGMVLALAPAAQATDFDDDNPACYRIAFVTISSTQAVSSVIDDYNAFVTAAAAAVTFPPALGATSWKCIGSTEAVSAKFNTGTDIIGLNDVPIYTTAGARVATGNADLWDGTIENPIYFADGTVAGVQGGAQEQTWTGTNPDGTSASSGDGHELGSGPSPNNIRMVRGGHTDAGWISGPSANDASAEHFLALSGLIGCIEDPRPEPPPTDFEADNPACYRIAFVTSSSDRPLSSDIDDYNAFVTTAAGAVTFPPALGATTWKCMGSTVAVSAKVNTGTDINGVNDVPIYTTAGARIATGNADLWDGTIENPIYFDDGTVAGIQGGLQEQTWTGTNPDGTSASSGDGRELGSGPSPNNIRMVRGGYTNAGWISGPSDHDAAARHFLALSDPICVGITKTVSETEVNLDLGFTNLTYTIDIVNTYTTALGGVVVTDTLPAEVSFVSSIPPADMTNGNEYIFDIGLLEPGSNAVIQIVVTVTSTVPGVITNVAMFSSTNTNVVLSGIMDTAETLLYYPADLDVTKTAFVNGTNVDYTITIVNLGSGDATDVTVVDTFPAELIYQSASPPPGPPVGNDYTFNLGTVPAGSNATIMISATYTSTASIFVTNSASADTSWFEDNMANNTGTVITPVGGGLVLLKSVSDPSVNLDLGPTNLIYTLDILNTYTVSLSGIVVTDALPFGVSFVTSSLAATETNGNARTFDVGLLGAGGSTSITLEVTVTSTVPGVITNFAFVHSTNTNVAAVSSQDTAETLLYYPADLEVHKTASLMGGNLTYTLAITNLGAGAAANLVVTDSFPAAVTFLSAMPNFSSMNGNDYIFNLGTLVAGGSTTITIQAEYTSSVPITVTNRAGAGTSWFEDNRSNNTDSVVSLVGGGHDLALTKTVSPTEMMVGDSNLTYTITVMNLSTAFAGSVVVTDSIPFSVRYLSSSHPASETNGNSYTFNIDFFGAGSTTTIVINAAYTGSVPGVITNWANVIGTNTEGSLVNNRDFALTTITNGGPPCVPGVDTDGDGMTDCEEICAGTNPNDPADFLWIQIARTGTQTVRRLTFPTTTGRTYRVDLNTNLYSNDWTTVISNLPGIGTERNVMHTSSATRVYYRIGVESP